MTSLKNREATIKKKYNITQEHYELIRNNQDNKCAICGSERASIARPNISFMIDHCHEKGHVRGLLCYSCNVGLGHFKDNIEILEKAIAYLKKDSSRYCKQVKKELILTIIPRPDEFIEHKFTVSQGVKINKNENGIVRNN